VAKYQIFSVYDFKSGLVLARDAWLLPKDAFPKIENAYIERGVIKKIKGYKEWGRFVNKVTNASLGTTVNNQLTYSGTLANTKLRPGDLVISTSESGESFTDQGNGTLTGSNGGSGTINYLTGAWSITYGANPGAGHSITATYSYFPELPIMGFTTYYKTDGSEEFLIFNTKRMNKYNPTTIKTEDISGSDIFTGEDYNFFWMENWRDKLFITNNVDRIKVYDGTTISDLNIDTNNDGNNDVDTALLIFSYKGHLVLLRTYENGVHCPQRARWSNENSYTDWYNGSAGYVDCETTDWIMGADFIGDDLVVLFERSVWVLKYTGDPNLPFIWRQIRSTEGCFSSYSVMPFSDEILFVGPVSLMGTDGMDIYNIDEKIPDFTLNFNQSAFKYIYGSVLEELKQCWLAYPSLTAEKNDSLLVMNYEEGHFAVIKLAIHCLGYYKINEQPPWDDWDIYWDDLDMLWDEKTVQAGYPINLGGTSDGIIYQLNYGGEFWTKTLLSNGWQDNRNPIPFEVYSGELNPFSENGVRARLGFIDILVNKDEGQTFYIDMFVDGDNTPYKTVEVICDGAIGDKTWKRVFSGAIGTFHQIRIWHNNRNQTVNLHAFNMAFAPAGRLAP